MKTKNCLSCWHLGPSRSARRRRKQARIQGFVEEIPGGPRAIFPPKLPRVFSRRPCWRNETIQWFSFGTQILFFCKYLLLFGSSNMTAVNTLYSEKTVFCSFCCRENTISFTLKTGPKRTGIIRRALGIFWHWPTMNLLSLDRTQVKHPQFVWWTVVLSGSVGYKVSLSKCHIKGFLNTSEWNKNDEQHQYDVELSPSLNFSPIRPRQTQLLLVSLCICIGNKRTERPVQYLVNWTYNTRKETDQDSHGTTVHYVTYVLDIV